MGRYIKSFFKPKMMMIRSERIERPAREPIRLGQSCLLKYADGDLSDMLKPEHRSSDDQPLTGLILVDAHNQRRVFFVSVSLLFLPTAVMDYELRGLNVKYYATSIKSSSFERAIELYRRTSDVEEVRNFLTLSLQDQEKQKYRGTKPND